VLRHWLYLEWPGEKIYPALNVSTPI